MSYNLWKSFKAVLGLPMPALDDFLHGQCFEVTAHDVLFYVFSVYCTILLYIICLFPCPLVMVMDILLTVWTLGCLTLYIP